MPNRFCAIVVLLFAMFAGIARPYAEPVDLELVLSVDSSGSIDDEEFVLQRLGYAKALTSPKVLKAIRSGPHKAIAVTYSEWSGPTIHNQVVGWTRIASAEDANRFAAELVTAPRLIFGGGTSLGGAIAFASMLFDGNGFEGRRRVIDVSGDGWNNRGQWPETPRDNAVAKGITINGLAILDYGDDTLAEYFRSSVIGGHGAFAIKAQGFKDFARAVIRKLIREIFISGRQAAPPQG